MSNRLGLSARANDYVRGGSPPPPPPDPTTLAELLATLDPISIWPMGDADTAVFLDTAGNSDGVWTRSPYGTQRPTLTDAGGSIEFRNGTEGSVAASTNHAAVAGTLSFFVVFADVTAKQALFNRYSGPSGDGGRFLIELLPPGQLSVKQTNDDGSVQVNVLSATAAVSKGVTHHVAVSYGADGLRLYLDGTEVAADMSITSGTRGSRECHWGAWYSGNLDPFTGLLSWFSWHARALSAAEIAGIATYKGGNVIWCNADDAGSILASDTLYFDVAANDIFAGSTPDVQVVTQPASGTFAVQPDKRVRITADAPGAHQGSYRIGISAPAILRFTSVTATGGWSPTRVAPLPAGFGFGPSTLVASDPTFEMRQSDIDANWDYFWDGGYPFRRLTYHASGPGGLPCIEDFHEANNVLSPGKFDFFDVALNLANYRFLCLLGHIYSDVHWGVEGKWWMINPGRGWTGDGYTRAAGAYGTDGFGANAMHPKNGGYGGTNSLGMLVSYAGQSSPYGTTGTRSSTPLLLNEWQAIALVVDLGSSPTASDGAYRGFVNGEERVTKTSIRPAQTSAANIYRSTCRFRPMSGGNPDQLNTYHNEGSNWHGGFFFYAVPR